MTPLPRHRHGAVAERLTCTVFRCPLIRGCLQATETGEFELDLDAFARANAIAPCAVCNAIVERAVARITARKYGT